MTEYARIVAEHMHRVYRRGLKYELRVIAMTADVPYDSLAFRAEYVVQEGILSIQQDKVGNYWIRLADDSIT